MRRCKDLLHEIFIEGLSGMATGLFATLIVGTIIQQIGSLIPGTIGTMLYVMGKIAASVTGAGIGIGVAVRFQESPLVIVSSATCGMMGGFAGKILAGTVLTEAGAIEAVLPLVDMVLLMTVNPGFGGQKYIESSTQKIKELRTMINGKGLDVDIQVDGGINKENVQVVLDAGANVIVAGTAVFGGTIPENAKEFLHIFEQQKG